MATLGNRFVASAPHVSLAVGEQVVDNHSNNGEEEDDETPEDLVGNGAVGLKDLDCRTPLAYYRRQRRLIHTPDKNIEYQDNETNDSTTSAVVPRLRGGRADSFIGDRSCKGKRRQPKLEEGDNGVVEHLDN